VRISELIQEGGGTRANPTISTIFGVPRLRLLEEDPLVNKPLVIYRATSWPLQIETARSRFLGLPQGCPIRSTVCVGPTEIQCLGGGGPCLVATSMSRTPLICHYLSQTCLRLRINLLAFYGGSTPSFRFTSSLLHLLLLMQGPSTI